MMSKIAAIKKENSLVCRKSGRTSPKDERHQLVCRKSGRTSPKDERHQSQQSLNSITFRPAISDRNNFSEKTNTKNETITWFPATKFLDVEENTAYSFAVSTISIDPITTDGPKFSQIMEKLTDELERHICKANLLISNNEEMPQFSEPVEELLRVAIGHTHLLLNKRMKQFREQLSRHLNPIAGQKVTKLNDLHGLWALIEMQLENIRSLFDKIEKCRLNGWAEHPIESNSIKNHL